MCLPYFKIVYLFCIHLRDILERKLGETRFGTSINATETTRKELIMKTIEEFYSKVKEDQKLQ